MGWQTCNECVEETLPSHPETANADDPKGGRARRAERVTISTHGCRNRRSECRDGNPGLGTETILRYGGRKGTTPAVQKAPAGDRPPAGRPPSPGRPPR